MTKISIAICCLFSLFALPVLAQRDGVRFFKGSWTKALAEAKQSNKLIFVNIYTEWSESSRRMREEVFPLKEVGEKYNSQFINYRVDGDWSEGELFNATYQLEGYPTYLFIDGNGDLLYRSSGYTGDPKQFLSLADTVLYFHEAKQTMPQYKVLYQSRRNDKDFVMEYLNRLILFGASDDIINTVRDDFFRQLTSAELKDTLIAGALLRLLTTIQSPVFDHIMSNQAFYRGITPQFTLTMGKVIYGSLAKAVETNDALLFNRAYTFRDKLEDPPPGYPYLFFMACNDYYIKTGQPELMIARAPVFIDSIGRLSVDEFTRRDQQQYNELMKPYTSGSLDSNAVPDFAYQQYMWRGTYTRYVAGVISKTAELFLTHAQQKEDLKKACAWAARSVDMDPYNHAFYAVLGKLYGKMGMKKEAASTFNRAIALGKEQMAYETVIKAYRDALKAL